MIFINTSAILRSTDILKEKSTNIEGKNSSLAPGAFNSSASGKLTSALSKVSTSYAEISAILNDLYIFLKNYSSDAEGGEYSLSDSGGEIIDDAVYAAIKNCEDLLDDISMGSKLFTSQMDMSTDNNDANKNGIMPILPSSLLRGFCSEIPFSRLDAAALTPNIRGLDFFKKPEGEDIPIELKSFTSRMTDNKGNNYEIEYSVYTSPNYDLNIKSNIAIFIEGNNGEFWSYGDSIFNENHQRPLPDGSNFKGKWVFDNYFNTANVAQTILVTIDCHNYYNIYNCNDEKASYFHDDLYELLTTIDQEYNTYFDPDDPTSSRNCITAGGYSEGGRIIYNLMPSILDYVANFAFFSPEDVMDPKVPEMINASDHSIRSLYMSCGSNEFTKSTHIPTAAKNLMSVDGLINGENLVFCVAETDSPSPDPNTNYKGHQTANAYINMCNAISYSYPNNG